MKNLIDKISAYKNATQSLLDKIDEHLQFVKKEVPQHLWSKFGIKDIASSQFSEYRFITENEGYTIPQTVGKIGTSFYYAGDFNYKVRFANSEQIVKWAKNLPEIMKKAEEYIQQLTLTAEELVK